MDPLELDDYHEKTVAELTGKIGFDPEPVSNCSQLSVVWGESAGLLLALPLFVSWVLATKLANGNFYSF